MIRKFFTGILSAFGRDNAGQVAPEVDAQVDVPSDLMPALRSIMRDQESFIYLLRMFWQVRFDKMSSDYLPAMDWLTRTFLPPDVVASSYHYPSRQGPSCFKELDHYALAREVAKKAFSCPTLIQK